MNNNVLHIHIKYCCILFTFVNFYFSNHTCFYRLMVVLYVYTEAFNTNYYITFHISFTGIDILHKERDFIVSADKFPL